MKYQKKFAARQQQQISEVQSSRTAGQEFDSVEELLRFDVKQTVVPPMIAERLGRSLQNEPRVPRPWWRRWLEKRGPRLK